MVSRLRHAFTVSAAVLALGAGVAHASTTAAVSVSSNAPVEARRFSYGGNVHIWVAPDGSIKAEVSSTGGHGQQGPWHAIRDVTGVPPEGDEVARLAVAIDHYDILAVWSMVSGAAYWAFRPVGGEAWTPAQELGQGMPVAVELSADGKAAAYGVFDPPDEGLVVRRWTEDTGWTDTNLSLPEGVSTVAVATESYDQAIVAWMAGDGAGGADVHAADRFPGGEFSDPAALGSVATPVPTGHDLAFLADTWAGGGGEATGVVEVVP